MSSFLEIVIVLSAIGVASFYLGRRYLKQIRKSDDAPGCNCGGANCPSKPKLPDHIARP